MQKITKAVLPVAGLGTRFLPATKAQPKEMLPLVDKPIIQYLVEQVVASGIQEIIFVTSQTKRAIEDHFDRNFELEYRLQQNNKKALLKEVTRVFKLARFAYVRQQTPRGWGDAILQTEHLIGNSPFAMLFGDDIIDSQVPVLKQLLNVYKKHPGTIMGVRRVAPQDVSHYGIMEGKKIAPNIWQVKKVHEKPSLDKAPSNYAVCGGFIMEPDIFTGLKDKKMSEGKEYQALENMMRQGKVFAHAYKGTYFDTGNKLDYLKATIHFGLKHPEVKKELKKYLKETKF